MSREYKVGVLGASGAVGREVLNCLTERGFPFSEVKALASSRSAGSKVEIGNSEITVEEVGPQSFKGLDLAIFSAGASVSREYAPIAAKSGCPVIDNSSCWRMDERVPLVVPEVNARVLAQHKGIIANPNCSTIQMLVALKPIYDAVGIRRIVVSTYQAVSGTGQKAIEELAEQTRQIFNCQEVTNQVYPHRIAFNCLPHIDVFMDNDYTKEEMKMVHETVKIMEDPNIRVTATAVRVPVFYGHSESLNIEFEKPLSAKDARAILSVAPGIMVLDNPSEKIYPMPIQAAGEDEVFVGRIREDETQPNTLNMWVVSDNIRKGAALNTVQIAERLIRDDLVRVPNRSEFL